MSETNFTERDREAVTKIRLFSSGPYAVLLQRAVQEIDSLRAQLGEAKKQREKWEALTLDQTRLAASYANEGDTLRSEVERTKAALRLIQWGRWGHPMHQTPFCPRCLRVEPHGHAPDCEVGAALAGGDNLNSAPSAAIVDIANSQARTITRLAECLKQIAALSTGWKRGNEGVHLLRIQDLVRPFVDAALAGGESKLASQPSTDLLSRLHTMMPEEQVAFLERFNGLSGDEIKALFQAKAQPETGGAA